MSKLIQITIRDIDAELYKEARKAAISEGVKIGELINMALAYFLGIKKEKK